MVTLVHEHVKNLAKTDPHRSAVLDGKQAVSYSQLQNMVERFSAALIANNTQKGDRIAFLAPPSLDFLVAYLSITSLGAIFVGLNPKYTYSELAYVIEDAEPIALYGRRSVRGRDFSNDVRKLLQDNPSLKHLGIYDDFDEMIAQGPAKISVDIDYFDPCALIYTSGTTGKPKGALIPHGGLVECCEAQIKAVGLAQPVTLNNLPINHIGCIGDITAFTLLAGGAIVFQEKFSPSGVLDLIEQNKISWWGQIPTMFQLALDVQDQSPRDLSSIKRIFTSGAPAPIPLVKRMTKICLHIQNAYGMTETVGSILWVLGGDDDIISGTIGKPIHPYNVRIADEHGTPAPNGQSGEVQVKGSVHMLGYWRNEPATKQAYTPDDWLRTGDLAIEREDGYYEMVGRLKDMFKSGGYNVYPREIEQALEAVPSIEAAIVIAIPDLKFHEVGCAYILPKTNANVDIASLPKVLKQTLANYKIPKQFNLVTNFPLLPNGKIDKQALRNTLGKS